MVRLVFRPYTRIRRTICTSVSLRASTRVSPGFALSRHSSPSFGSCPPCCGVVRGGPAGAASVARVGRRVALCIAFAARVRVSSTRPLAREADSLVRVSRRVGACRLSGGCVWGCVGWVSGAVWSCEGYDPERPHPTQAPPPLAIYTPPHAPPRRANNHHGTAPPTRRARSACPSAISSTSCTLSSKSFPSFPHGTCSLSVSRTTM